MIDWKDDLIKKAEQLHIEGGESNVRVRTDSGSSDRNSVGRSGSLRISKGSKEISENKLTSNRGGTNTMITIEGALSDIEKIEKDETITSDVKVLRALKVLLKFLSTMRSNQLLTDVEKKAIQDAQKNREKKSEGK